MTIKEIAEQVIQKLTPIYGPGESRSIVSIIFEDLFGIRGYSDQPFTRINQLEAVTYRLLEGEPVQYIVGQCNFYGYTFKVSPNVLIPRPETEELVRWILSDLKGSHRQLDVMDIGTGCGCIAITLKKNKRTLRLFGIEKSLDALNVARNNARDHSTLVQFYLMDILDQSLWPSLGRQDIIVSNPPYIAEDERQHMPDHVLGYEPLDALFPGGDDPLIFYKKIAALAHLHLNPGGRIYLEINEFYAEEISLLYQDYDWSVELKHDLQGKPRMLKVSI